MGFWSSLFSPQNSSPTSLLTYNSSVSGTIRTARQYAEIFHDALADLCQSRSDDKYLQDIMFSTLGKTLGAYESCSYEESHDGHSNKWRVFYGDRQQENHSITLELQTPNAVQCDFNGKVIPHGCNFRITADDISRNSGAERSESTSSQKKGGCGCLFLILFILAGVAAGVWYLWR